MLKSGESETNIPEFLGDSDLYKTHQDKIRDGINN